VDVAFSPEDRCVATAGIDGLVRVFDTSTGELQSELVAHNSAVLSVEFSPDGRRLASGGHDRSVRIWDTQSFDQVARLGGYGDYVRSVAWDTRGERLLTGSGDGTVRLWDTVPARAHADALAPREEALTRIEPLVAKLFEELHDSARVAERITSDKTLNDFERKLARQVALRIALERSPPK
jgi:WD40 repeat protein